MTVIFDPATDSCSVTTPGVRAAGGWRGGALLADGRVLLLPGTYGRTWWTAGSGIRRRTRMRLAPELAALAAVGQGAYLGGCVLPDGRVVFAPCVWPQPGGVGAWAGGGVWAGYCAGGVLESPAVRVVRVRCAHCGQYCALPSAKCVKFYVSENNSHAFPGCGCSQTTSNTNSGGCDDCHFVSSA